VLARYIGARCRARRSVALDWTADPQVWHDEFAIDASYLHRCAVACTRSNDGIGAQLVEDAADLPSVMGSRVLRLDCAERTTRLHGYYCHLGFKRVRIIDVEHAKSSARPAWSASP
jgi:ribosomal protein S18 acetylase RimI-like enzyme